MKNKHVQLIALLLTIFCTIALLAACNDQVPEDTTDSSPVSADTPGADNTEETTDIQTQENTSEQIQDSTSSEIDQTTTSVETTKPIEETTTSEETTNFEETTEKSEETTEAPEVTTEKQEETTDPPHVHSWNEYRVIQTTTCTIGGIEERECACGEKETILSEPLGHKETTTPAVAPTCTKDGVSEGKYCTVCSETLVLSKVIPATGHTDGEWTVTNEATCTENGSKSLKCTICLEVLKTETLAALGHTDGEWIVDKEATADDDGSRHQICAVCKATIKTEIIAAKPHVPGEWIVDNEATCKVDGQKHQVCADCGATIKTEKIPALGHTEGEWYTVTEATCTANGTKQMSCKSCNEVLLKDTVSALGHKDGEWVTDSEPSCTSTRSPKLICAVCQSVLKTESIPALGHTEVKDEAVKAGCTTHGLSEGKHCSVCNAILVAQTIVPATGHNVSAWIIDLEATCLAEGKRHIECLDCLDILSSESTPVLPHVEVTDEGIAATCTESGLTDGRHCSACSTVLVAQQTIDPLGHNEKVLNSVKATCTETGLTEGKICSVCNEVLTAQQTVDALGHKEKALKAKDPTCTEDGLTEGKRCSRCSQILVPQEAIPALGHTEGEWVVEREATNTQTGLKNLPCSVCGGILKTETIPMLNGIIYTVKVADGAGNPIAGLKVSFLNGSTVVKTATTDANGNIEVDIAPATYTVTVDAGDDYYKETYTVSSSAPDLDITLVKYATNPLMEYPDEVNGVYEIGVGSVRVKVANGERRFFFFTPTEGAIYHVYVDSANIDVGHFGGSFFVQDNNVGNVDDNGTLILKVLKSQVGNTLVIGLDSKSATVDECTITIERFDDIETDISELPWESFVPSNVPEKTDRPAGTLTSVNIVVNMSTMANIAEIPVVYNEADGFYHLKTIDGPILYVKITTDSPYLAAFKTISDVTNIGSYVYDENNNFLFKESYNLAIDAYAAVANTDGVVALTDELIYILKAAGKQKGWYDPDSPNYLFSSTVVKTVNAWLFACCYYN